VSRIKEQGCSVFLKEKEKRLCKKAEVIPTCRLTGGKRGGVFKRRGYAAMGAVNRGAMKTLEKRGKEGCRTAASKNQAAAERERILKDSPPRRGENRCRAKAVQALRERGGVVSPAG